MIILDGKATAAAIRAELKIEIQSLQDWAGRPPGLAVILVGEDSASQIYVRNKEKACAEVGVYSEAHRLPPDTKGAQLLGLIDELNERADIDGILLQLPLPRGLDSQACLIRISPDKDVDGFHPVNMGKLALGLPGFRPCTPAGVLELLRRYNLSPAGHKAVVVGRSNIVGKPLALMLCQPGATANATVTVCHSGTKDLTAECRQADFLFLAMGRPRCISADMVKPGAVVVDIGINRTEEGLCGDCDYTSLEGLVRAMTPVPGGVGPMTIAQLLINTVQAYKTRIE
jgi:methylenetetrahydrofolate dehydrogenase (NADP+)/methenyltetrahydrofolate cyclohydrolase